ncbi:ATP-dependent RNA helicase DbpA [Thalassolituus sp. LLYu03]|uniref:ATP-dependent RNA helicase DbpA n=1 Tax=Thalassolituus sp. LLYu03 TaxID=3421656 RepID=UPI003D26B516
MSQTGFSALNALSPEQIDNLSRLGYEHMTAIQEKALPPALEGKDLLAKAKTGSGKTAAFGIALLNKLNPRFFGVQALVMCPTRELSTQVADELRKLARYQPNIKVVVLCGGVSIGPQIASLEHGAHVVVGTPGRIKDHLRKNTLKIDQLQTLVLDEADRMLDMGFRDDIRDIASQTPAQRQTLLFSATYPDNIAQLSDELQRDPIDIAVESVHQTSTITQQWILCGRDEKAATLAKALSHFQVQQAVMFCNTRQAVEDLTQYLRNQGYLTLALHGDMEQRDRDQVYVQFRQGSAHFLVATDVAARGLDVDDLPAVVNYELPRDADVYIHRIGRTGRAGKEGLALSLITEKEDYKRAAIADTQGYDVPLMSPAELKPSGAAIQKPAMVSLCISGGRKNKIRAGDILGALTSAGGITGQQVGKIDILDFVAYVAIEREVANKALAHLQKSRIKNQSVKVRRV